MSDKLPSDEEPNDQEKAIAERDWVPGLTVKARSIDEKDRTLVAVVSTSMVDRDNEVVEPRAFRKRIRSYMRNPLLLWMHDRFGPPIGKALSVDITDEAVEAKLFFRGDTELAADVFSAYQQGLLTSFSVGFRTFKAEPGGMGQDGSRLPVRITDAELFEISACTVPVNTAATVKAARIVSLLERSQFGQGVRQVETVYSQPTDLDVLKRVPMIVKSRLEALRDGKELPAAEAAAIEDIRGVISAAAAPGAADNGEVLRALRELSDMVKAG